QIRSVSRQLFPQLRNRGKRPWLRSPPQQHAHFNLLIPVRRTRIPSPRHHRPQTTFQLHPILSSCHDHPPNHSIEPRPGPKVYPHPALECGGSPPLLKRPTLPPTVIPAWVPL